MNIGDRNYFAGKTILVTGASGFIGNRLCNRLKELGARIYGISTRKQKKSDIIDKWLVGDLADFNFTKSVYEQSRPDIVFHLAAFASGQRDLEAVRLTYDNNLTSTVNVLTASTEIGNKRLILAGSMEEPEISDDEMIPASPYAASKWASTIYSQMFHRLYEIPVAIARIFKVYGPGDKNFNRIVPYVIRSLINQEKPSLSKGTRMIDWICVDDVVEGLIRMAYAKNIEGLSIDLGTGILNSVQDVCKKIESIIGGDIHLEFGELTDRPFEKTRVADVATAREYLDWGPSLSMDQGLERTVEWYVNYDGRK